MSGDTFAISQTYRLPQACAPDQVAKWNGTVWTCAADLNTDTDTTYDAGVCQQDILSPHKGLSF